MLGYSRLCFPAGGTDIRAQSIVDPSSLAGRSLQRPWSEGAGLWGGASSVLVVQVCPSLGRRPYLRDGGGLVSTSV